MVLGNKMGLPHNLVGIGALLFALGTVTGVLLNAAFGIIAGTVFGFLVVITALGLLYDTTRAPNQADDEADEDEEEDRPNLTFLAWVLHSLTTIISITGLIWGIMLFVTICYEIDFELKTWLLPLIFALFAQGWSLYDAFIRRPIHTALEQQTDGKEDS
jgi:hypothetical protein